MKNLHGLAASAIGCEVIIWNSIFILIVLKLAFIEHITVFIYASGPLALYRGKNIYAFNIFFIAFQEVIHGHRQITGRQVLSSVAHLRQP